MQFACPQCGFDGTPNGITLFQRFPVDPRLGIRPVDIGISTWAHCKRGPSNAARHPRRKQPRFLQPQQSCLGNDDGPTDIDRCAGPAFHEEFRLRQTYALNVGGQHDPAANQIFQQVLGSPEQILGKQFRCFGLDGIVQIIPLGGLRFRDIERLPPECLQARLVGRRGGGSGLWMDRNGNAVPAQQAVQCRIT